MVSVFFGALFHAIVRMEIFTWIAGHTRVLSDLTSGTTFGTPDTLTIDTDLRETLLVTVKLAGAL